jgi:carotenoid 1,2-hydratase
VSEDGTQGLNIIGFVGSVFSPYYAYRRRKSPVDPENYCSINLALYGRDRRWCMTERGRSQVSRRASAFIVGPSSMAWQDGSLIINVNEISAPIPRRVVGEIRFTPKITNSRAEPLDADGRHFWRVVAPVAEVNVSLVQPRLCWKGSGYHDMNWGAEPLEKSFRQWTWSRALFGNSTAVLYDVELRGGGSKHLGLCFDKAGVHNFDLPSNVNLDKTFWRMPRIIRSEGPAAIVSTLEDAPFYSRSLIRSKLFGREALSVHESLSLDRFRMPIVQAMLPFRMPRRPG